ncbi:uncharacterized protein LOC128743616 [Sabethes cyaneus]|uniref:uncharacterized protein LOC128743616 n=1 Tax=Sabethes cyaneus TaxID=53552 RepID=UPI00237E76B4|nr:uncharacterized protein LOC128743616 [Sabethes cyaneus]
MANQRKIRFIIVIALICVSSAGPINNYNYNYNYNNYSPFGIHERATHITSYNYNQNYNSPFGVQDRALRHNYVATSTSPATPTETPLGWLEELCLNRTGSHQTFQRLNSTVSALSACFRAKIPFLENLPSSFKITNATREEFFSRACPELRESLKCLTPAVSEVQNCLEENESKLVTLVHTTLPKMLNFFCKNNGEIFFMNGRKYIDCIQHIDQASGCMDTLPESALYMNVDKYDAHQCNELHKVRQCVQLKVEECEGPKLIEGFDLFYRPLVNQTACRNFIALDKYREIESNEITFFRKK